MQLTFSIPGEFFGRNGADVIQRCMKTAVMRVAQDLRTEVLRSTSADLQVRSSSLLKSWAGAPKIEERGDDVEATLSSAIKYAAIHEFGGTIKPVKAKDLYIPVMPALRNASDTRSKISPREVYASKGSVVGMKGVFINKKRTALMGVQGKGLPPVPIFALKKEVEIPARKYLTHAMEATAAKAEATVSSAIDAAFATMGL